MKTRIISGISMAVLVALVLVAGFFADMLIVTAFVALIAAVSVYELIHNAAGIKNFWCSLIAFVFTVGMVFTASHFLSGIYDISTGGDAISYDKLYTAPVIAIILVLSYFLFCTVAIIFGFEEFNLGKIATLVGLPLIYSLAFATLGCIIVETKGIYYLLLAFNFACVCDMGAYFAGVTMGKHKLCPDISPKKTVEGAIGGIALSVIASLVIVLCFGNTGKLLITLAITIPMCIIGMLGDLFASAIKRSVGIKDYGSLIPGHGGVLDRVDSILLIAPVMFLLVILGVI